MTEIIKIACENSGETMHVNMGATLQDVANMLALPNKYPFIACYVNNQLKELSYRIFSPVTIRFIDPTHFEGIRVYQRTLFFTLNKAVHDLFPNKKFLIKHSVSKGFYCEIDGMEEISQDDLDAIKNRMNELIKSNIPIVKEKVTSAEAEEMFRKLNFEDKIELLKTRPSLYTTTYSLANMVGNFYGALATSTGVLHLFDIRKYYKGLYIAVPKRTNPEELESMVPQQKMFDVFEEYKHWVDVMGVSNIGSLNAKILMGNASELIKVAEAFHEKKIANIADTIDTANKERGVRLALISGPSSSGKTTSAKRLGIQLRILGLNPVLISLDDYFVERDKTPRDENGEFDYEDIEALDLKTFNKHLETLLSGGSVNIPRYDFITGKRFQTEKPLVLDDRSIMVIEGIHGLNPRLTASIEDKFKFKIYVSAFTSISMDNLSRIPTTDGRLLRRIVRDYYTRGADAVATLRRWPSVRKGEEKHIFPYQEEAEVMFNSSLFYELAVLRKFAEPILHEVNDVDQEYGEARRLIKFLDNFISVDPTEIPPTSILREFIGDSSFIY